MGKKKRQADINISIDKKKSLPARRSRKKKITIIISIIILLAVVVLGLIFFLPSLFGPNLQETADAISDFSAKYSTYAEDSSCDDLFYYYNDEKLQENLENCTVPSEKLGQLVDIMASSSDVNNNTDIKKQFDAFHEAFLRLDNEENFYKARIRYMAWIEFKDKYYANYDDELEVDATISPLVESGDEELIDFANRWGTATKELNEATQKKDESAEALEAYNTAQESFDAIEDEYYDLEYSIRDDFGPWLNPDAIGELFHTFERTFAKEYKTLYD